MPWQCGCFDAGAETGNGKNPGIALAVNHFFGIPVSGFVLVFNVIMLIAGYLILGRQFAATTVISTFAYPAALGMFQEAVWRSGADRGYFAMHSVFRTWYWNQPGNRYSRRRFHGRNGYSPFGAEPFFPDSSISQYVCV